MDHQDFGSFYAACYRRLLRQLVLVTCDPAEAEDVLQEAFARLASRWERIGVYDAPEAWVRRVALNLAASGATRMRRRAAALMRLSASQPQARPELTADLLDLAAGLRALPVGQRQAIVLHYLAGLSLEEIASELGVAVGTVKSRLARGRAALNARLAPATAKELLQDG